MNQRLVKHVSLCGGGILHILLLFPGFFAPYNFREQNRNLPLSRPTPFHFVDASGRFHLRPFVYALKEGPGAVSGHPEEDFGRRYPIHFFVEGSTYFVVGGWESRLHFFGVEQPAHIFLLGTDEFGRDELTRVLFGGRVSLLAGVLATAISLLTGTVLGVVSGFCGKWVDYCLMRFLEIFLAAPWVYLLLAVRAALPLRINSEDAFLLLAVILGLIGWARPARLFRGIVLSARERPFVLAARVMGASRTHIFYRHILPQIFPAFLTLAALMIPQFVLAEVTLSFLGLGVGETGP